MLNIQYEEFQQTLQKKLEYLQFVINKWKKINMKNINDFFESNQTINKKKLDEYIEGKEKEVSNLNRIIENYFKKNITSFL